MISTNVNKLCCEDISLIENYEKAIVDETETWHCHHRFGTDKCMSTQELIDNDLYYNRPASELIFLTPSEHHSLHGINIRQETREIMSYSHLLNDPEFRKLIQKQWWYNFKKKNSRTLNKNEDKKAIEIELVINEKIKELKNKAEENVIKKLKREAKRLEREAKKSENDKIYKNKSIKKAIETRKKNEKIKKKEKMKLWWENHKKKQAQEKIWYENYKKKIAENQ